MSAALQKERDEALALVDQQTRRLVAAEKARDEAREQVKGLDGTLRAVEAARGTLLRRESELELALDEAEQARDAVLAEMAAACEALGPAWFAGGVTLPDAIRRKCAALEQLASVEPVLAAAVLRINEGLAAGDGEQEVLVQGEDWASLVQLAHAAGGEGEP